MEGLNLLLDPLSALRRIGVKPPWGIVVLPLWFQAASRTLLSLEDGLDAFLARTVDSRHLDLFLGELLRVLIWMLSRRFLQNEFLGKLLWLHHFLLYL